MRTEKCPCDKTITWDNGGNYSSYNVGEFLKKTGWKVIFALEGELIHICPECFIKVKDLCKQIVEITKEEDISIGNVLRMN